jgi:hypothetical protein
MWISTRISTWISTWISTHIQQDIHVHIQFIQWDIHYVSNAFSKHIQLVILAYPTGYQDISKGMSHLSNWISNWIFGLICSQGIQAGSCIAIPICILAPAPASSAASDGLPLCSERKRGVRNACSYPTWAACVAAPGRATLLPLPMLRGSHQCFAAGSYQLQVLQAWVCDIADP